MSNNEVANNLIGNDPIQSGGNVDPNYIVDPTNTGVENNQNTGNPEENPSNVSPLEYKQNPERVEYWQSKYDKLYNTTLQMQEQLRRAEYESQIQESENQGPELPIKPTRPSNYSEYEATTDPDSESARYKQLLSEYQSDMFTYLTDREQKREEAYQEQIAREQEAEQSRQYVSGVYSDVLARGATPEKARNFIQWANSFDSFTLDNIYAFYDFLQSRQAVNTQAKLNVPPPVGVMGGQTQKPLNDQDVFNVGLLKYKR